MPDGSSRQPTFNTLEREKSFRCPPSKGSTYSILSEFVAPHIESFNALFDDSGLPAGDGDGKGLLTTALKDIGERVVFDSTGKDGSDWGNRMRSTVSVISTVPSTDPGSVWIESVNIARPMVSEKDRTAKERRVFPAEVCASFFLLVCTY